MGLWEALSRALRELDLPKMILQKRHTPDFNNRKSNHRRSNDKSSSATLYRDDTPSVVANNATARSGVIVFWSTAPSFSAEQNSKETRQSADRLPGPYGCETIMTKS